MAKRVPKRPSKRPRPPAAPTEQPATPGPPPPPADRRPDRSPPVVGIGASAGGLEAIGRFLEHAPAGSGMAYVVVQHLDPTHKGMLVELLQRVTPMPVSQAEDDQAVEADHVYVIPSNADMSILHGRLHLLPQATPRGLNLPIDFFFRSLAADQQERAVGVILSGMGTDGTLGLRTLKEKAGAVFVQAPTSARFDGMPRSVIDAGLADVVAPVEELPARILAFRRHAAQLVRPEQPLEEKAVGALDKVFVLLRTQTGADFALYKRSTIYRRIERRMGLHQITGLDDYVRYLRQNPHEIELLFRELLIGVTSFFRDPLAWQHLKDEVLPALLARRTGETGLRAWVAGCSTGEEAYSLAMVFKEAIEPLRGVRNVKLQIFATDLDKEAIETARRGVYPDNIVADVSPERLRRFFVDHDHGYRVSKEIRDMVVFAPQNLISDPPFTKLDILSCRNLLIYLSSDLQKKLIPLFHYALKPGGVLFLGSAETIGGFYGLFTPLDGTTRLYRRVEQPAVAPIELPTTLQGTLDLEADHASDQERAPEPPLPARAGPPNLQVLADRVLVQRFAPIGVLCNDRGDVLYISGRTGRYLEPAVGKASLNLFAMAREGLRYDLSRAFAAALRSNRPVTLRGVEVATNGSKQVLDLTVQKLAEPRELQGTVMVVFVEVPGIKEPRAGTRLRRPSEPRRIAELEAELHHAREEVQTTREEMQSSQEELKSTNEELQSTNEELQSTNEELQSTNEELTTSKEELQSLNEELQTVNHELQAKVDELSRSTNDLKNLLDSTNIATLFLDGDLRVRRFTTSTAKIIKLIPGDVGRVITDIASDLDYPDLADDAREVLRTLVFKEKQVTTRDGRWFTVRVMPYRTLENVIDGVVITFIDAAATRALQMARQQQESQIRQMSEALPLLVWTAGADGGCTFVGRRWLDYTAVPEREQLGWGWLDRVHPEDRDRVREGWRGAVEAAQPFETELRLRGAAGVYRRFRMKAVPIRDSRGELVSWYAASVDLGEDREQGEREDGG